MKPSHSRKLRPMPTFPRPRIVRQGVRQEGGRLGYHVTDSSAQAPNFIAEQLLFELIATLAKRDPCGLQSSPDPVLIVHSLESPN